MTPSNNKKRKRDDDDSTNNNNGSPEQLVEPSIAIPLLPTPYQPGGGTINYLDNVESILGTDFSPPDRYFTVSALLGRLRLPLKLPPTTSAAAAMAEAERTVPVYNSKKEEQEAEKKAKLTKLSFEKQQNLVALGDNEFYHREHVDTVKLLALFKRISGHRTSVVFRKPVDSSLAPGYDERILFPMDLSLIRKMIVSRMIKSYAAFHRCVGLICHNCVKFNGRESDYAALTREFEDNVDEKILQDVRVATEEAAASAAAVAAANAAATKNVASAVASAAPSTAAPASAATASTGTKNNGTA